MAFYKSNKTTNGLTLGLEQPPITNSLPTLCEPQKTTKNQKNLLKILSFSHQLLVSLLLYDKCCNMWLISSEKHMKKNE